MRYWMKRMAVVDDVALPGPDLVRGDVGNGTGEGL